MKLKYLDLIKRCQQGDLTAFEAIVKKYQSKVLGTAYLVTKSATTAEEIAQDTFYRVYTSIDKLKSPEAFEHWLYNIAVNLSRNAIRRKHLLTVPLKEEYKEQISSDYKTPEKELVRKETAEDIKKAIADLNVRLRLPVILKYYTGLTDRQIADTLRCPVGTVKSRLHAARAQLGRALSEYEVKSEGGNKR